MSLFGSILRSADSAVDDVAETALMQMRGPGRFVPGRKGYVPKKGDWDIEGILRKSGEAEEALYGNSAWEAARKSVETEQYDSLLEDFGVSRREAIPEDLLPDFDQQWSMAVDGGVLDDLAMQRATEVAADLEVAYKNVMSPVRKRVDELPANHPFKKYVKLNAVNYGNSLEQDDDVLALLEDLYTIVDEGVDRKDITTVFKTLTKNGTMELDKNLYRVSYLGLTRIPEKDRLKALGDIRDNWDNIKEYVANVVSMHPELKESIPALTTEVVDNVMDIYRTLSPERRKEFFKELPGWYDDLDGILRMHENA